MQLAERMPLRSSVSIKCIVKILLNLTGGSPQEKSLPFSRATFLNLPINIDNLRMHLGDE